MNIAIVCVPFSNDVARWGNANGPQAILDAGLIDELKKRGHSVRTPTWVEMHKGERTRDSVTNLALISKRQSDLITHAFAEGADYVICLEGNCCHAPGAMGATMRITPSHRAGIIWYDAHGDMHTLQTSSTGLLGGMPFAVIMGWEFDDWRMASGIDKAVPVSATAIIGASDLDIEESEAIAAHHMPYLHADEMMKGGSGAKTAALLKPLASNADHWYLHYDMDVSGPEAVPGPGTPAPYWPPAQELFDSVAATARTLPVKVFGLSAYNPVTDPSRVGAKFGVDVVLAAVDAAK
jgi:arginase